MTDRSKEIDLSNIMLKQFNYKIKMSLQFAKIKDLIKFLKDILRTSRKS